MNDSEFSYFLFIIYYINIIILLYNFITEIYVFIDLQRKNRYNFLIF